jgi:formylglycine-generating enzyme required for sulfatase activity
MVPIKPGSFMMGDNHGDRSEQPEHRVTLQRPFAIGRFEVTLAQWMTCVNVGGCSYTPDMGAGSDPQTPVRNVSWTDAQKYLSWLKATTGKPYRLPTEAEWEYATRAGTNTRYWWGNQMVPGHANCQGCGGEWDRDTPAKVGSFTPNPFGLYDTSGSVWEWVSDCWHKSYQGAPTNGESWDEPSCQEHVVRGGAWRNDTTYIHSASRFFYGTDVRYLLHGFRVARDLP